MALDPIPALLSALQAYLPPATASAAPTGRERERLASLRAAAERVLTLPSGPADPADDDVWLVQATGLRLRAGQALLHLGQHATAEVPAALERAVQRWDQAGNLTLLTQAGRHEAQAVQEAAQAALVAVRGAARATPGVLALLLAVAEAMTVLDSACTLLRALELGFVNLLRERLRAAQAVQPAEQRAALLPDGRPFVDPGAALLRVAQGFGVTPDLAARAA